MPLEFRPTRWSDAKLGDRLGGLKQELGDEFRQIFSRLVVTLSPAEPPQQKQPMTLVLPLHMANMEIQDVLQAAPIVVVYTPIFGLHTFSGYQALAARSGPWDLAPGCAYNSALSAAAGDLSSTWVMWDS